MLENLLLKKLEEGPQERTKIRKIFKSISTTKELHQLMERLQEENVILITYDNKIKLNTHLICDKCEGKGWVEKIKKPT